jgi:hypothetical protein
MTDPSSADTGGSEPPPVNETGSQKTRRFYRLADLEPGLKILAQGLAAKRADAAIFALAARCEAAEKHFNVASDAYAVAELAEPHDQAAEDEAERLQDIASDVSHVANMAEALREAFYAGPPNLNPASSSGK